MYQMRHRWWQTLTILLCIPAILFLLANNTYSQMESSPGIAAVPNAPLLTATPSPTVVGPTQPTLVVQDGLITFPGAYISVPIHFTDGGIDNINAIIFSVQFDPTCLAFDAQDHNEDGLPDAVGFNSALPVRHIKAVNLDDLANGQIHIVIAEPFLQDYLTSLTSLVSVTFQTSCSPTGPERETVVSLINSSIGTTTGMPIDAITVDGVITIRHMPTITPSPTATATWYGGCRSTSATAQGVDAISAPLCTTTPTDTLTPTPTPTLPTLSIPSNIWAHINSRVTVPVEYQSGNQSIAAMAFSIDYDEECLAFDETDQNGDGLPDDIRRPHLPSDFTLLVTSDPADTDGELDITIFNLTSHTATLPDLEPLIEIEFTTLPCVYIGHYRNAPINFSTDPTSSFGDLNGQEVPGHTVNGSVTVVDPTPTPSPSPTATSSPTATTTPTLCPIPPPSPVLVAPVTSLTTALSQMISVSQSHNAYSLEWVEINTQSGTFRATSDFDRIPITLLPNTIHTLTVTALSRFYYCNDSFEFTTSTTVDQHGSPLIIEQISTTQIEEALYLSSTSGGRLADAARTRFADEDIVVYLTESEEWLLFFDGSDVGLRKTDIDAFAFDPITGELLLSLDVPVQIPTLGWIDDSDILAFTPTQLGEQTTGEFSLYWDGSAHDLTSNSEDVDALAFANLETATPKLVISTIGAVRVGPANTKYGDEDLLLFNPTTNAWEGYFDGSTVRLTAGSEDLSSLWIDESDLYLTTKGNFRISSLDQLQGNSNEIILCEQQPTGGCFLHKIWTGAEHGFPRESIDALDIGTLDRTLLTGLNATVTADRETVPDFEIDPSEEGTDAEEVDGFDRIQPEEDEEVLQYQLWLPVIQR